MSNRIRKKLSQEGNDKQKERISIGNDKNYARLYNSLAKSPAWQDLKYSSQSFYMCLILMTRQDNLDQRVKCRFPETIYKKYGFNHSTANRATEELEDHGFISVERFKNKTPSRFTLIEDWKKWSK